MESIKIQFKNQRRNIMKHQRHVANVPATGPARTLCQIVDGANWNDDVVKRGSV